MQELSCLEKELKFFGNFGDLLIACFVIHLLFVVFHSNYVDCSGENGSSRRGCTVAYH